MFVAAFIAPLGASVTLTSRLTTKHVRRLPRVSVVTTRASAASAGAQSGAWRPRERSRDRDEDGTSAQPPIDSESTAEDELSTPPLNLQQPVDLGAPTSTTKSNNRAALQVDDGTLSLETSTRSKCEVRAFTYDGLYRT